MKTLKDCMSYLDGSYTAYKYVDIEVIQEYSDSSFVTDKWKRWIGKHKNVHYWVVLANGYAVAMNENPSYGISFPVMKYKS